MVIFMTAILAKMRFFAKITVDKLRVTIFFFEFGNLVDGGKDS